MLGRKICDDRLILCTYQSREPLTNPRFQRDITDHQVKGLKLFLKLSLVDLEFITKRMI